MELKTIDHLKQSRKKLLTSKLDLGYRSEMQLQK